MDIIDDATDRLDIEISRHVKAIQNPRGPVIGAKILFRHGKMTRAFFVTALVLLITTATN